MCTSLDTLNRKCILLVSNKKTITTANTVFCVDRAYHAMHSATWHLHALLKRPFRYAAATYFNIVSREKGHNNCNDNNNQHNATTSTHHSPSASRPSSYCDMSCRGTNETCAGKRQRIPSTEHSPPETASFYMDRQVAQFCQVHALNALFGRQIVTHPSMLAYAKSHKQNKSGDNWLSNAFNERTGNFSDMIINHWLRGVSTPKVYIKSVGIHMKRGSSKEEFLADLPAGYDRFLLVTERHAMCMRRCNKTNTWYLLYSEVGRPKRIASTREWASLEGHKKILYKGDVGNNSHLHPVERASLPQPVPNMFLDEDDWIHPSATHIMTRIRRAAEPRQVLTRKGNAPSQFQRARTYSQVVQSTGMTEPPQRFPGVQVTASCEQHSTASQTPAKQSASTGLRALKQSVPVSKTRTKPYKCKPIETFSAQPPAVATVHMPAVHAQSYLPTTPKSTSREHSRRPDGDTIEPPMMSPSTGVGGIDSNIPTRETDSTPASPPPSRQIQAYLPVQPPITRSLTNLVA